MLALPLEKMHVTSAFGPRGAIRLPDGTVKPAGQHNGVDLRAAIGTAVFTPIDGVIDHINYTSRGALQMFIVGTGRDAGFRVALVHLDDIVEPPGELVQRGQHVAVSGNSGGVDPHLHLELRKNGALVDPMPFFRGTGGGGGGGGLGLVAALVGAKLIGVL